MLALPNSVSNILRIFIYGGSLSSYLLRKQNRYIALDIDTSGVKVDETMKTYISCPSPFADAISNYHLELYRAAEEGQEIPRRNGSKCPNYFAVYRRYNEIAWIFQHRSSFKNAQEYANCLWAHHNPV
jgi:hypothetical protein